MEKKGLFRFTKTIQKIMGEKPIGVDEDNRELEFHIVGLIDANEGIREGIAQVLNFFLLDLSYKRPNKGKVILGGDQLTTKDIRVA